MRGDARAGRRFLGRALECLAEGVGVHVARGDVAAVGGELDHELSPHAGAPAGDDSETSCERFHDSPLVRERGPYRRDAKGGEAVAPAS